MDYDTVVVHNYVTYSDLERLAHADRLCLTPGDANIKLPAPLFAPRLRVLHVAKCHQPLTQLVSAETLQAVKTMLIVESEHCLDGLTVIGECPRLEQVIVRRQKLSAAATEWLCGQSGLKSLSLTDMPINDATIAQLGCKAVLRRLDVFRTNVAFAREEEYEDIFPAVRSLDISETRVSSDAVGVMRCLFPQVERLMAHDTAMTEDDLRVISKWSNLRVLDSNTPGVDMDLSGEEFWDL